jgi:hypothetical protein
MLGGPLQDVSHPVDMRVTGPVGNSMTAAQVIGSSVNEED